MQRRGHAPRATCSPTNAHRPVIWFSGMKRSAKANPRASRCSSGGRTRITAAVRDDSALYGLLDRIQDLALHLVSLSELGGDTEP